MTECFQGTSAMVVLDIGDRYLIRGSTHITCAKNRNSLQSRMNGLAKVEFFISSIGGNFTAIVFPLQGKHREVREILIAWLERPASTPTAGRAPLRQSSNKHIGHGQVNPQTAGDNPNKTGTGGIPPKDLIGTIRDATFLRDERKEGSRGVMVFAVRHGENEWEGKLPASSAGELVKLPLHGTTKLRIAGLTGRILQLSPVRQQRESMS